MRTLLVFVLTLGLGSGATAQANSPFKALVDAIEAGDAATVSTQIQAGAPLEKRDALGLLPLHLAASLGRIEIAKVLLSAGAKLDGQAKDGRLPLQVAASSGKLGMIRFLVASGAPVDGVGGYNVSFRASGVTALMEAAMDGRVEAVGLLLLLGANVNARDSNGDIPLNYAAFGGQSGSFAALLAAGSERSVVGYAGTAKDLALRYGKAKPALWDLVEAAGCLSEEELKTAGR